MKPELDIPDTTQVTILEIRPLPSRLIEFDARFPFNIDVIATLHPAWKAVLDDIAFQVLNSHEWKF
jgi:hypothetical protein